MIVLNNMPTDRVAHLRERERVYVCVCVFMILYIYISTLY